MMDTIKANEPHFTVEIDGVGAPLRVIEFEGEEGLSRLFRFSMLLESDQQDLDPASAVGRKAVFMLYAQRHARTVHGLVNRFEFAGVERRVGLYRLEIVPDVYVLSQRYQVRIFQDKTVLDIIKEVLDGAGISGSAYKVSCKGSYPSLEYCVQYRESDLNFLDRLAEHFGIFYFFEFTDKATTMILGDAPDVHQAVVAGGSIIYRPRTGLMESQDYVHALRMGYSLVTGKHTVRDYNFKTPQVDLTQDHTTAPKDLEWYDYPGVYENKNEGGALAQVRSEADACRRHNGSGRSTSVRLVPGYTVRLEEHPVDQYNAQYLITSVTHHGSQTTADQAGGYGEEPYRNEFTAQPASLPFRPVVHTLKPRVQGTQTAVVTGPKGEEIYCDEYGRIKVRFHWDRSGSADDKSSCWVRVSQKWAGPSWGGVFIPRIGQEVIVDFLEGDPDRPIVTGCMYNARNMPPYPLPSKQTVSTVKSDSSIGGGGFNEFRFEDEKGSEEVFLHAQKNWTIRVLNNKDENIGANETQSVGRNRTRSVGKDENVSIGDNRTKSVGKSESVSIGQNLTTSVGIDESRAVGKNRSTQVGANDELQVGTNVTMSVGADAKTSVAKNVSLAAGNDYTIKVGKKLGVDAGKSVMIKGGDEITLKCGSASLSMKKDGSIQLKGKDIKVNGSGNIVLKGNQIKEN